MWRYDFDRAATSAGASNFPDTGVKTAAFGAQWDGGGVMPDAGGRTSGGPLAVPEPTDVIPSGVTTTYTLAIGGSETGVINTVGDHDWFRVDLVAGQSYIFTMTGAQDAFLSLYAPSPGFALAIDDDGSPVAGSLDSQLRYTATATGTYWLDAHAYEGSGVSNTGAYTVTAALGPPQNPLDTIDLGTIAPLHIDVYFATKSQTWNGDVSARNWTQAEIDAAMAALATYSVVTPLTFSRTTSSSGAEFVLTLSDLTAGELGHFETVGGVGYGAFNAFDLSWTQGLSPGGAGFTTLIHEFGHGLGLAHPHDNGGVSEIMQGVTGPFNSYGTWGLNQQIYTTMSYNRGWENGNSAGFPRGSNTSGNQATPAALDIALLQEKYGSAPHNATDTNYAVPTGLFQTIWDTGGVDTIAYSGSQSAAIDLRAATLLNATGGGGYVSYIYGGWGGFTIANGVVIENASGGSGNDSLTGNDFANVLTGNAGNDNLNGGDGADTLTGGDGIDQLHGDAGNDLLDGGAGDDFLDGGAGADTIDGGDGNDILLFSNSSSSTSWTYDIAAAASAAGFTFDGDLVRNVEGMNMTLGSGDDTLIITDAFLGQSQWNAGAGADQIIVDFSGKTAWVYFDATFDTVRTLDGTISFSGVENYSFTAGLGNDGFRGDGRADTVAGGAGDDGLDGRDGDDVLDGGAGNDGLYGGNGVDHLTGDDGNDTLDGGDGDDNLIGGAGNDTLRGGFGADTLDGGAGNDTLYAGEVSSELAQGDVLDGGDGIDSATIEYFGVAGQAVLFDATQAAGPADYVFASSLTLRNVEQFHLQTGAADDTVYASEVNMGSSWSASTGFDRLVLDLSTAASTVQTAYTFHDPVGDDFVHASVTVNGLTFYALYIEAVTLTGGSVGDLLVGYNYADVLDGRGGNDTLTGNGGADVLDGGEGADTLTGGAGDDTYIVDNFGDVASEDANAGTDTIQSSISWTLGANLENLTLTGAGANSAAGNELANTITGNDADNVLYGRAANDVLSAAGGADTLWGGDGDDSLSGGVGADLLDGGNNNDTLAGGDDVDTLYGRAGNDSLDGGAGADTMYGGAGDDVYVVDNVGDMTIENSASGIDTVQASITFGLNAFIENLTLTGADAINGVGNILGNTLTGNDANNTLSGGAGADTLNGMGGDDVLNGGNGNDTLSGGTGNDILDGGNNDDTLSGGDGNDTLYGRTQNDALSGAAGADTLYGGDGDDILNGGADNDLLDGGNHNDTLSGGDGDDTLYGRQNDDTLSGNDGADTLYGGDGVDTLNGGAGADVLNGGNGDDVFTFAAGEASGDTLQDFRGNGAATGDTIVFSGYGLAIDGATFVQIDATHWEITSADGTIHDIITVSNGASFDLSDYLFA